MANFLLDSDILIWILRGQRETIETMEHLRSDDNNTFGCSSLTVLEIWTGARAGEEKKTQALLDSIQIFPVNGPVARRAAALLRAAKKENNPREWIDAVIASTCLIESLTLVTYNRKDFPYSGLSLYPF
jgi:predicted nucleic acid-binding protein